jgi:hypothetical protein
MEIHLMKKYECPSKHSNPNVKRAYLIIPDGVSGQRLAAFQRLIARLKYLEAKEQ